MKVRFSFVWVDGGLDFSVNIWCRILFRKAVLILFIFIRFFTLRKGLCSRR